MAGRAEDSATGALHAFVVPLGHEPALQAEWPDGRLAGPRWPALLTTREPLPVVDPAFALQQLPDAHWVRGGSPAALARAAAVHVVPRLELTGAPWQLHSFVPDPQAYRTLAPLVPELAAAFQAELRQSAPGLTGHQAPAGGELRRSAAGAAGAGGESVAAGLLRAAPAAAGRVATTSRPGRAGARPCRTIVGRRPGPTASWWRGSPGWAQPRRPGERCVDLGGAPGGWAWTALARGASVVAVDRSPLAPPAAGHPGLQAIIGDAFGYRPPQPVDWLLCDVICRPERTIELAETWMRQGLCRRLVATLKFTGTGDYAVIERARQRLGAVGWRFVRMKHLANHHNEVAILARRTGTVLATSSPTRRTAAGCPARWSSSRKRSASATTNDPNTLPRPTPSSRASRVTTRTTVSVVASTLAVRAPGDSTAVSPNTAPGPICRSCAPLARARS